MKSFGGCTHGERGPAEDERPSTWAAGMQVTLLQDHRLLSHFSPTTVRRNSQPSGLK